MSVIFDGALIKKMLLQTKMYRRNAFYFECDSATNSLEQFSTQIEH